MARELVPELHDIGKLTDLWSTHKPHNFEEFDFAAHKILSTTPTWRGVLEHHCTYEPPGPRRYVLYPTSPDTVLCCLADTTASAVSRGELLEGEQRRTTDSDTVQRPWRLPSPTSFRFLQAVQAARFVQEDPSGEDFLRDFDELLRTRAEETRYPVTSLRTHVELTGKIWRILRSSFKLEDSDLGSKTREEVQQVLGRVRNQWRLTVATFKPAIMVKPFRTRDLGVFSVLGQTIEEATARFADNILFSAPEVILVISGQDGVMRDLEELFLGGGFWVEVTQGTRSLDELRKEDLLATLGHGARTRREFPSLEPEIRPPICEVCRMAPAVRSWHEGDISEDLCERCEGIREAGKSLVKLAGWFNETVAWLHIGLDLDQLLGKALPELCGQQMGVAKQEVDVRFPLLGEFRADWNAFLHKADCDLRSRFGDANLERLLPGLCCVKLDKEAEIIDILRVFNEAIEEYFPRFSKLDSSPVRLGVSVSAAKFPFFEHWRCLESLEDDVFVRLTGRGKMRASLKSLPEIVAAAGLPRKSALHRLAEVARLSEQLAKVKMHDRADSDQAAYRRLREGLLPLGLSYKSILTLAQITGG